jgi:peroxiredoxin
MTTLAKQLEEVFVNFTANAPIHAQDKINGARSEFVNSFNHPNVLQTGSRFPPFLLPNPTGGQTSSNDLLAKGAILVTFYRGQWCPFCNLALRAYQQNLEKFHEKGVEFVAISPELPDKTLSTQEKNDLKFPVLSDVGNKYARQLGIIWKQPENLKPIFKEFGHDLVEFYGDDSFEVPIPATFLVGKDGLVKNVFVNPDYRKRLEPSLALEWIDKMD